MQNGPFDFGSLIIFAVIIILGAAVVIAAYLVFSTRSMIAHKEAGASADPEAIESAQHSLRAMVLPPPPDFDESDTFLTHAESSVLLITQARAMNRLSDVAALMTPAFYATLTAQIRADPHNSCEVDINVEKAAVRGVQQLGQRLDVTTWFGTTLKSPQGPENHSQSVISVVVAQETWHFVRSIEHAHQQDSVSEGRICPNCGGPLGTNDSGTCVYCGQVLVGNPHGWLVSNIQIEPIVQGTIRR